MKVSCIIVSWNVHELLKKCIQSILERSYSFPVEVIVVDNASQDGSAEMVAQNFPAVKLICNSENRGFGAACNQGIAVASGEYVFFLNPDSQLENGALETLVSYMDAHPDVGMSAPQIRNGDGSIQQSVRRFPTTFSQLFILLKLRRFASRIPVLRKYFALDFDYTQDAQEIDQPMGAALLIRTSVLKKVGVFDERFFIWFEEVDLCRRIKESGQKINYLSSAQVTHSGGKSFVQQGILERQKNFFRSCGRYLRKHCGIGGMLVGAGMALFAWCVETVQLAVDFFDRAIPSIDKKNKEERHAPFQDPWAKNLFAITLCLIVLVEICSFFGYLYGPITALAFGAVVGFVFLLGVWRLEYAVAALFVELIIGSKGYLLSITVGDTLISFRIALFAVVLAAWIFTEVRILAKDHTLQKTFSALWRESRLLRWYALVVGIAGIGVLNGVIQGNSKALIYADSNAWLFFIIAPCVYRAVADHSAIHRLGTILTAGMVAQIGKVLLVFYVMGHKGFGVEGLTIFYRWIRSTGVGEITLLSHIYRIFFQSQLYIVVLICILVCIGAYRVRRASVSNPQISVVAFLRAQWVHLFFLAGAWASLILSFSRSFWLGTAVFGCIICTAVFWKWRRSTHAFVFWISGNIAALVCALLLLFAVSSIPVPSSQGVFAIDSLTDRVKDVQDEAAAASRWNLLPVLVIEISGKPLLGYGFGKTVTYVSHDPRVLLINPTGTYTTYAFEWGYLDMVVKLGLIGLIVYLCMIRELLLQGVFALKKRAHELNTDTPAFISGLVFGIGALLVIHVFTPYLNHPLGIALLIASGVIFERLNGENQPPPWAGESRMKVAMDK